LLHEITNQLQAQLYDLQNQIVSMKLDFNKWVLLQISGYWRPRHPSLMGGPLPWKYDDDKDSPPPLKE
jgi:hypothetical protein